MFNTKYFTCFLLALVIGITSCSTDEDPDSQNPDPDPDTNITRNPFMLIAGSTGDEYLYASVVDAKGNVYVTGVFTGECSFAGTKLTSLGSKDAFLAKYDMGGRLIWVKQIGGASHSQGQALALDKDGNICVVGEYAGSVTVGSTTLTAIGQYNTFIAKYNSDGEVVSAFSDGRSGRYIDNAGLSWVRGVAFDDANNMYITGEKYYHVMFGLTPLNGHDEPNDMFVVKYNSSNTVQWARQAANVSPYGITVNGAGTHIFITGSVFGETVVGSTSVTAAGERDIIVVGFNTTGNVIAATTFGGTKDDAGRSISFAPDGSLYVVGYFMDDVEFGSTTLTAGGFNDAAIIKMNTAGTVSWAKQLDGYSFPNEVIVDKDNHIFVAGWFTGDIKLGTHTLTGQNGSIDAYVAEFDNTGNYVWHARTGGLQSEMAESVCVDPAGNVFMTGHFSAAIVYGDVGLTSAGGRDMFVIKIPKNK